MFNTNKTRFKNYEPIILFYCLNENENENKNENENEQVDNFKGNLKIVLNSSDDSSFFATNDSEMKWIIERRIFRH